MDLAVQVGGFLNLVAGWQCSLVPQVVLALHLRTVDVAVDGISTHDECAEDKRAKIDKANDQDAKAISRCLSIRVSAVLGWIPCPPNVPSFQRLRAVRE